MEHTGVHLTILGKILSTALYPPTNHMKVTDELGHVLLIEPCELLQLATWAQNHREELAQAQVLLDEIAQTEQERM